MRKLSLMLVAILVLSLSSVVLAANWEDGNWEAWSDVSGRSYQYAKVFVEDGEIIAVTLREFTWLGVEKDWFSYSWEQAVDAAQTLGVEFVAAQGPDIDMVSGATSSSTGWKQAVERALVKADPAAREAQGEYFDGTFFGRSHTGGRRYYETVWVTIENDQIVDLKFDRVLEDGEFLDPDDYGWPLEQARETYRKAAIESEPGYVDTISGATGSSLMWNVAVRDALDRARVR